MGSVIGVIAQFCVFWYGRCNGSRSSEFPIRDREMRTADARSTSACGCFVRPGEESTWLSKGIRVGPAPLSHHTRCHRRPIRIARWRTCRSSLLLHWTSCLGGGSRATGGGQSAAFRKRRFFPPWLGPTLHLGKSFIRQTSDKLHADKSYRQHIGEIARSRQPCRSAGAALAEAAGTRA